MHEQDIVELFSSKIFLGSHRVWVTQFDFKRSLKSDIQSVRGHARRKHRIRRIEERGGKAERNHRGQKFPLPLLLPSSSVPRFVINSPSLFFPPPSESPSLAVVKRGKSLVKYIFVKGFNSSVRAQNEPLLTSCYYSEHAKGGRGGRRSEIDHCSSPLFSREGAPMKFSSCLEEKGRATWKGLLLSCDIIRSQTKFALSLSPSSYL